MFSVYPKQFSSSTIYHITTKNLERQLVGHIILLEGEPRLEVSGEELAVGVLLDGGEHRLVDGLLVSLPLGRDLQANHEHTITEITTFSKSPKTENYPVFILYSRCMPGVQQRRAQRSLPSSSA